MNTLWFICFIGIGATAAMDLWSILRQSWLGIPFPNYGLVGRWIAYMADGQFRHDSIAAAAPVRAEQVLGLTAHYLIGIAFAALLIAIFGQAWINHPMIIPALFMGVVTVAAPFFLMQPGMGAGIAASRTKNPCSTRLQSLLNHVIFGFGLYASAWAIKLALAL